MTLRLDIKISIGKGMPSIEQGDPNYKAQHSQSERI